MANATYFTSDRLRSALRGTLLGFLIGCLAACSSSTATSPTTPVVADAAAASGNDYRISPEDVIDISVWKEPDLQRQLAVRPDGGISFPLIGNVLAAGKTATQLQQDITVGLSEYIPDAEVTVSVVQVKGLKVFVTGQVKKPGQYLIGRYVDVLQAITLAGGLTPFADKRKVRILRRGAAGEQVFTFDYTQVQRGQGLQQNILLQSGDTVVVP